MKTAIKPIVPNPVANSKTRFVVTIQHSYFYLFYRFTVSYYKNDQNIWMIRLRVPNNYSISLEYKRWDILALEILPSGGTLVEP